MTITDFLEMNKISPNFIDTNTTVAFILEEMKRATNKEKSSLSMLNSGLKADNKILFNKPIAVIDAGGTNFRTCLVTFNQEGKADISDFKVSSMPGVEKEVSAEEFFNQIASRIEYIIDKTDRIGFCFSYPAETIFPHDAKALYFSKEIKAKEVIGLPLGKNLFDILEKNGYSMRNKKIVILNDTVATLLAGLPYLENRNANVCIGFILGTGLNCAHIQNGYIINQEVGNLNLQTGLLDKAFLQTTDNPELYKFEKMISGAYMGRFGLFLLKEAQKQGFLNNITLPDSISSPQMGAFLKQENTIFKDISDSNLEQIHTVFKTIVLRAAKLSACSLIASALASDTIGTLNNSKKILVNADGTTFYKMPFLKEETEKHLKKYLSNHQISAEIIKIDSSPIIGSAVAAMCI